MNNASPTILQELVGRDFIFDNETRVYSAEISVPCVYPSNTVMLSLITSERVRGSLGPLNLIGLPPPDSGIQIYDPRPGITKHAGDDLALRWAVVPELARCVHDGHLEQVVSLCTGTGERVECAPQIEVSADRREASISLSPEMEGEYRVLITWGGNDGSMVLGRGYSEPFRVVPPLPTDRPTFVWPNRATTLHRGGTYTISWTGMEHEPGDRQVSIVLRNPAERLAYHRLGTESANRGRFDWEIPLCDERYQGDGYQFRLRVLDDESLSTDSVDFQIADTGARFTGDAGRAGSFWNSTSSNGLPGDLTTFCLWERRWT